MVDAMRQGQCHPNVKATAKEKQSVIESVPEDGVRLLALCQSRRVDQEYVLGEETKTLCERSFGADTQARGLHAS